MAKIFRDTNNDATIMVMLFIICVIMSYILQAVVINYKKQQTPAKIKPTKYSENISVVVNG